MRIERQTDGQTGYLRVLQVSGQRSVGSTHVLLLLSDLLQLLLQILFLHLIIKRSFIQTNDSRVDQVNQLMISTEDHGGCWDVFTFLLLIEKHKSDLLVFISPSAAPRVL